MFRYRRTALALGAFFLLGLAGYAALIYGDHQKARDGLAEDLKIERLPTSVRNLVCKYEPVWTDVLWNCYFEIEPKDFPALLSGRSYQANVENTTNYDVCCIERLGEDFKIAKRYYVEPSEYKNGGSITIYTDASQRQVRYRLYVE